MRAKFTVDVDIPDDHIEASGIDAALAFYLSRAQIACEQMAHPSCPEMNSGRVRDMNGNARGTWTVTYEEN